MGTEVGNIFYSVDIDTGAFIRGTREVNKQSDSMAAGFLNAENALSKLATAIAGVMTIQAVANEFRKAIQVTADFNATISNLSALTGAVGKDLEVFRQAAIDIGGSTSLSASQAAEAMKLIGGAAPDLLKSADALKAVTNDAVILAEAAGVTLPEAATALTATLNQFQLGAEESTRVINVLAAGAKEGSSEIQQTVEVLKNAGVVAAQSGLSFEEFNGAVQALAKGEIKGSEAGTALRNIITILNTQIDGKLKPSVVGLSQALANLEQKNLSQTEAVKLFGRENITAASTLVQFRGEMDRVTTAVTGTDEAIRQARTNTDNLKGDIANLSSAYETLQIAVGDLSDGSLRELTQNLTEILTQVGQNKEAISTFFSAAGTAAASFGAIITGRVITAMYGYTASIVQNTAAQLTARPAVTGLSAALGIQAKALTASTVAMNVAGVAARGLRTAMALLGGPAGVVLLAGVAIYEYMNRADAAKPATDALTNSVSQLGTAAERASQRFSKLLSDVNNLNKQELTVRTDQVEDALKRAESDLKRYERLFAKGNTTVTVGLIDQTKANIQLLRTELEKLKGTTTQTGTPGGKPASVFGGEDTGTGKKTEAQKAAEQNAEALQKLREEVYQTTLAADELERRQAEISLNEYATPEQIEEARRLGDALYRVHEATKAAEKAEDDRKKKKQEDEKRQQVLGQEDPIAGEQQRFQQQLANLKMLNEAKLIEDQRYLDLKAQAEMAHDAQMKALQEENFRRQSVSNELLMASLDQLQQGATNALVGLLTGANNSEDAIRGLATSILNEAVGALVQLGIEQAKNAVIGQATQAAAAGTAAATGAAMTASYAPAAAAASIASFGGAATAGLAALAGAIPAALGLFGGRQYGGPVTPGGMYRINESGAPEVFNAANGRQYMLPNQRGDVVSNKDSSSSSQGNGAPIINVHNYSGGPANATAQFDETHRRWVIDVVAGDMAEDGKIGRMSNKINGTRRPGQ